MTSLLSSTSHFGRSVLLHHHAAATSRRAATSQAAQSMMSGSNTGASSALLGGGGAGMSSMGLRRRSGISLSTLRVPHFEAYEWTEEAREFQRKRITKMLKRKAAMESEAVVIPRE